MRRQRKVKIVATLGPASDARERMAAMVEAGADVFRVNMSHGGPDDMRARVAAIREVSRDCGRPIGVLVDLQGPKLRVGDIAGGVATLEKGRSFRLDLDPAPGDATRAPLPHREIFQALKPGATLLLDDGKLRLEAREVGDDFARCTVSVGGALKPRKGVNLPGAVLPLAALSDKDRRDLAAAVEAKVDWIALSFVQRPEDVAEARELAQGKAAILAKIEKPAALDRLYEIVDLADGVMVARGDLGVEAPLEQVPGIQKRITRTARYAGKPVIVATQMLESMIEAPSPTRAEVSDVATAVYDGADAVMLSAESAVGAHPIEAVARMDAIAAQVERDPYYRQIVDATVTSPEPTSADAITQAARTVAETIKAAAIVCFTKSGSTGLRAARERAEAPVLALTPVAATASRLALAWGLHCVVTEDADTFRAMVARACDVAETQGFARAGDRIVITAGVPFGTPGATNILRIATIGGEYG